MFPFHPGERIRWLARNGHEWLHGTVRDAHGGFLTVRMADGSHRVVDAMFTDVQRVIKDAYKTA
jgi:hypothetical protein